jgi:hypothetical protein
MASSGGAAASGLIVQHQILHSGPVEQRPHRVTPWG